jgi:hypothetical protein
MKELRKDLVYPWDDCQIYFKTRYVITDTTEQPKWPSGWKLIRWEPRSDHMLAVFRVVGPPQARDAATVRAWLNLLKTEETA